MGSKNIADVGRALTPGDERESARDIARSNRHVPVRRAPWLTGEAERHGASARRERQKIEVTTGRTIGGAAVVRAVVVESSKNVRS